MASSSEHEFLSLAPLNLASDDDSNSSPISSIRPHLDTLFAEFSRTRNRLSRSPPARIRRTQPSSSLHSFSSPSLHTRTLDLRNLEYVSEYDSHLMCPICHVPFISPVVLECDHTFCSECYDQYHQGANSFQEDQCPTCRMELDTGPRKASRLITNMCNDLMVRCPNEHCGQVLPRGCMEQHTSKDCQEQKLNCPDEACTRLTKRKNFVQDRCIHTSHVECDCGELIELGRGEWLRHKDQECPRTGTKCDKCGERISRTQSPTSSPHICRELLPKCPGAEVGCDERLEPAELDAHAAQCTLARMAPYMAKQARLLSSLQEQLTQSQVRNDVLETGLNKIHDLLRTRLPDPSDAESSVSSHSGPVEEIERISTPSRHHLPSHQNINTSLALPAHLRALTPSPTAHLHSAIETQTATQTQLLLAQNESLRQDFTALSGETSNLVSALENLEGRTSMQIMNETLRIKEDLAHTNAALFSTRAQVSWLLSRERGQGQNAGGRGRAGGGGGGAAAAGPTSEAATAGPSSGPGGAAYDTFPSIPGSNSTSPRLMGVRRSSGAGGGSQERVKL